MLTWFQPWIQHQLCLFWQMLMTRGTKAILINNTEASFYNFISHEQLVGGTRDHTNTNIVDRNIL